MTTIDVKKVFLFDTNAYRVLTFGRDLKESRQIAREMRRLEGGRGHSALAHPIVAWELFAHLVDDSDPAYELCRNSLVALGEHTWSRDDAGEGIWLIADAMATVCKELFGDLPLKYEEGLKNLASLIVHVVRYAPDLSNPVAKQNINDLSRAMVTKEQSWVSSMGGVLDRFSPGSAQVVFGGESDEETLKKLRAYLTSREFFESWSRYIVASNAVELGIYSPAPEMFERAAEAVRTLFPVPFQLMRALLLKMATSRPPNLASRKRKRWNFVWDSLISFSVGPGTIDGQSVYMVTADAEIAEAAEAAGFRGHVITLDAYKQCVGMS